MNTESTEVRKPFEPSRMVAVQGDAIPSEWNVLTGRIISCAMTVHSCLGPGLRENLYEQAMLHETELSRLHVERQVGFRVAFKGLDIGLQVINLIVDNKVILELKSVAELRDVDSAQLVGYLRFTGVPLGLLINYHTSKLKDGLVRKINWPPGKTALTQTTRVHSVNSVPTP